MMPMVRRQRRGFHQTYNDFAQAMNIECAPGTPCNIPGQQSIFGSQVTNYAQHMNQQYNQNAHATNQGL